jgi:hypothetical protein
MALPALLRSDLVPVDRATVAAQTESSAASRLAFVIEHQRHSNWCWAAVAASIASFYEAATRWSQCAVADAELRRSDCCGAGGSGACNVGGYLRTALALVGHLDDWIQASSTFAAVIVEIDGGRPLCARTRWVGGGAHFVALFGYNGAGGPSGVDLVSVGDPGYGNSDVSYAEFRDGYRGSGTWTHSYICR